MCSTWSCLTWLMTSPGLFTSSLPKSMWTHCFLHHIKAVNLRSKGNQQLNKYWQDEWSWRKCNLLYFSHLKQNNLPCVFYAKLSQSRSESGIGSGTYDSSCLVWYNCVCNPAICDCLKVITYEIQLVSSCFKHVRWGKQDGQTVNWRLTAGAWSECS